MSARRTSGLPRLPIDGLRTALALLAEYPIDRVIAETVDINRRSINDLRRVARGAPQYLPGLLSGELSLYQAVKLVPPQQLFAKPPEPKFCEGCGSPILRGRKSPSAWAKQRFCRRNCDKRIDPLTRIKRDVVIDENGCWNWQRHSRGGYGRISIGGKESQVARIIFERYYGLVPSGMRVHHKCDNSGCCNPRHLEALDESELVERAPKRFAFVNRHKTHCVRGHEFTAATTLISKLGSRVCRKCLSIRDQGYYQKRKSHAGELTNND
jgi:hypothetical protein